MSLWQHFACFVLPVMIGMSSSSIKRGNQMNESKKTRPSHVPEENVYNKMHWTIVLALISVAAAVYVFVQSNG
jgi:hypothetical protein